MPHQLIAGEASDELAAELHRVPGEWRCLQCRARVSSSPAETERPACPAGCPKRCVPLTWKRFGPEQEQRLSALRRQYDGAVEEQGRLRQLLVESERVRALREMDLARWRRLWWPVLAGVALAAGMIGALGGGWGR